MTRESGLLFQSIASLILFLENNDLDIISFKDLEILVNTYFHSLLNLKHLGSIDRIAQGILLFFLTKIIEQKWWRYTQPRPKE